LRDIIKNKNIFEGEFMVMNMRYVFVLSLGVLAQTNFVVGMKGPGGQGGDGAVGDATQAMASLAVNDGCDASVGNPTGVAVAIPVAHAGESKRVDPLSLSMSDGMHTLIYMIDCASEEDLDGVKALVIMRGIDDDYFNREKFVATRPDMSSPFWHALKKCAHKEGTPAQQAVRFKMLAVLAGVAPESKKRIKLDGYPFHYAAQFKDTIELARFFLDHKICEPNQLNAQGQTAIFGATDMAMAKFLVEERGVLPKENSGYNAPAVKHFKIVRNGTKWVVHGARR